MKWPVRIVTFTSIVMLFAASSASAQVPPPPPKKDSVRRLPELGVVYKRRDTTHVDTAGVNPLQKLTLPVTASITADRIKETVNVVDAEDAVKYLPSIFLRKRNYGDNQATIQTRVWGVSSSARTLVFADGVPLTALIANNNSIGAPRWGLVSPQEIARVDMMYGPFSAAYAGNSVGGVVEITTRLPEKLEGSIGQTQALQSFALYGTEETFGTSQTAAHVGDRFGRFSFWASGTYQHSNSQPLAYVTSTTFPASTTGGFAEQNKLGATANVLGSAGLLTTNMTNARIKLAYDLSDVVRAAYTFGVWNNSSKSAVVPFLIDNSGNATYAGQSGFATNTNRLSELHTAHSFSLRSDTRSDWDFEIVGTLYRFNRDQQRSPLTASATGTTLAFPGRLALLDGTGWGTFDVKGAWHTGGLDAPHAVSFGAHYDHYTLRNPTLNVPDWATSDSAASTSVATEGDGKTRSQALWAQDRWRISPVLALTIGGRLEGWRGYDGYNVNGSTKVIQPEVTASKFSPKASLAWDATRRVTVSLSAAKAYRFPTAAELYQLVSTGSTFTSPDPDLRPDDVFSTELRFDARLRAGYARVSLFQDDVHDAIISQFLPLVPSSPTLYSYISNVDHVRARGIEIAAGGQDVLVNGLGLSGSVTYVDAKTLALSGRASATAPAGGAVGKRLPNIPDWRANAVASYRVSPRIAATVAARYSGEVFSTLDNADVNPNTYQGFSSWFVVDAKVNFNLTPHLNASLGVDNLNNRKYFFFHPFPQRTLVGSVTYGF